MTLRPVNQATASNNPLLTEAALCNKNIAAVTKLAQAYLSTLSPLPHKVTQDQAKKYEVLLTVLNTKINEESKKDYSGILGNISLLFTRMFWYNPDTAINAAVAMQEMLSMAQASYDLEAARTACYPDEVAALKTSVREHTAAWTSLSSSLTQMKSLAMQTQKTLNDAHITQQIQEHKSDVSTCMQACRKNQALLSEGLNLDEGGQTVGGTGSQAAASLEALFLAGDSSSRVKASLDTYEKNMLNIATTTESDLEKLSKYANTSKEQIKGYIAQLDALFAEVSKIASTMPDTLSTDLDETQRDQAIAQRNVLQEHIKEISLLQQMVKTAAQVRDDTAAKPAILAATHGLIATLNQNIEKMQTNAQAIFTGNYQIKEIASQIAEKAAQIAEEETKNKQLKTLTEEIDRVNSELKDCRSRLLIEESALVAAGYENQLKTLREPSFLSAPTTYFLSDEQRSIQIGDIQSKQIAKESEISTLKEWIKTLESKTENQPLKDSDLRLETLRREQQELKDKVTSLEATVKEQTINRNDARKQALLSLGIKESDLKSNSG